MEEEEEVKRKERKKKKARIKEMPDGDVPSAPVLQDFMGKNKSWESSLRNHSSGVSEQLYKQPLRFSLVLSTPVAKPFLTLFFIT